MNFKKIAATVLMGSFAFGTVVTPVSALNPQTVTPQNPQPVVTGSNATSNSQESMNTGTERNLPNTNTEVSFDLHAHVFDYGESIDQVQIDFSKLLGDETIDPSSLDVTDFNVVATATDPYANPNEDNSVYSGPRTITDVSVNDGIVTLDLACEFGGANESTLQYVGRNIDVSLSYSVSMTGEVTLNNGDVLDKNLISFTQDEIINEETEAFKAGTSNGLNYQLYTPTNAADGNKHPLIVWFHGGGEGGKDEIQNNTAQLRANRGALGFTTPEAQEIFGGAYVLAPQAPYGWGSEEMINNATGLINTIANTYNVDKDRIYVFGCSAGGNMTVKTAIANPELFAAVVPICGAYGSVSDEELLTMSDMNIWLVHAENDTTVTANNTSELLHALIPESIYTSYETVNVDGVEYPGHWSWIYVARNMPTFNGQSIFEWTAQQTLNPETTEVPFDLHAHVFDYGEAIDQVQIDLTKVTSGTIDEKALTADMFKVTATATDPYNSNAVLYEDVERTITGITVENGIVTLKLECAYGAAGQSTLNYSFDAGRNLSATVSYDIELTDDITLSDGNTIDKDTLVFNQEDIINEETDAFISGNSDGLNYRLFIPENAGDGQEHPLIVWFHGGGEGGFGEAQNNSSQLRANRGALGFAEAGAQEIFGGAYVLAPQSPSSWPQEGQSSIDSATALIDTISKTYNIDENRIYVVGCSAGGWMTVNMTIANPDLFAAVVPICGAFSANTDEELLTMKDNNIWMVHALNDTSVTPENTSDRLYKLIPNSIYTTYETVNVDGVEYPGHWSWIYVARNMPTNNGQTIFQWMASQTLAEDVDNPSVDVDNPDDTTQTPSTTPDKVVQTGDTQMIYPYIALMLAAMTATAGFVVTRSRKENY